MAPKNDTQMMEALHMILRVSAQYWTTRIARKGFRIQCEASKCQLIVQENRRDGAIKVFRGTNITTVDGFRVLGSVIGTLSACDKYMESENEKSATLTEKVSKIAKKSPTNAYSCYTKGVQKNYFSK